MLRNRLHLSIVFETATPAATEASRAIAAPGPLAPAPGAASRPTAGTWRSYSLLGCVMLGYVGVYLCRKNFSVAVPMVQRAFGVNRAAIGDVISYSAGAYALGKLVFGPVIDRFGGRICFLLVLAGVALFGALGALANSLPMLVLCYTANRFCGSAGWGSILKQTPRWFAQNRISLAVAALSLSFVFGGVAALVLAGKIAAVTHDNWRMVMGLPSLVLTAILVLCSRVLPNDAPAKRNVAGRDAGGFHFSHLLRVSRSSQLWVVCAMAFSLYIMRETFNDWTVDFFRTEGGAAMSSQVAAWLSTPFDAAGAVGILLLGWVFDHLSRPARTVVLAASLGILSALIYSLPMLFRFGLWEVEAAIALIGFLSYGPYSLLAGVFAVEIGGEDGVGTVAGTVDSAGYLGTVLAGRCFGRLVDSGGYRLGFHVLALVTLSAAVLCLGLRSKPRSLTTLTTHP